MDRFKNLLPISLCALGILLSSGPTSANNIRTTAHEPSVACSDMDMVSLRSAAAIDLPFHTLFRITTPSIALLSKTNGTPVSLHEAMDINGTVIVRVEDELTYFVSEAPLVPGAHVVISDFFTSMVYADGYSDATGVFIATNIPDGTLNIVVSEPTHSTFQGTFVLNSGATLNIAAFMSRLPDEDNDGYSPPLDCNDADPTIHPGAPEVCNDGIDNDCDGAVDEVSTYFADVDGDGFGDQSTDSVACSAPAGYVIDNTDQCPNDPLKVAPGTCGCGVLDDPTDTDNDGIADCIDTCPTAPGQIGSLCDDGDPDTNLSQLNTSCTCEAVPEVGDYRSVTSGTWASPGSWEVFSGSAFVPASLPPDQSSGWITIRNGHSITISSPVTVDQVVVWSGGTLAISSTLNLNDGPGDDLRVRGTLTSASTLNGPGNVAVRNGGVYSLISSTFSVNSVVDVEAGGTMNKNGTTSQSLNFSGVINNAGTFNMNGGWISGSQSGVTTINNLTGGVININGWFSNTIGWLTVNFFNAGTFNRNAAALSTFSMSGTIRNLEGGVVNANAGSLRWSPFGLTPDLTHQRGRFNVAPGATLSVGGNFGFQFLGTEINNNGTVGPSPTYFTGSSVQTLSGTGTVNQLEISNPVGVSLGGTQTISSYLNLSSGKVSMGNNSFLLGSSSLNGGGPASYLVTDGTGSLQRTVPSSSNVFFPVGVANSYLPALVQLDGASTTDDIRVRAADGVSTTYDANDNPTGSAISTNTLLRTWVIREGTAGGSNATVRLQWNSADEGSGFTRSACRVSNNSGSAWDAQADGAAGGGEPFTRDRSGITAFGPFTVNSGTADLCPGGPEPGTPCDDNSACTINDVVGTNCLCEGTFADTDADGTCDANDLCPGGPEPGTPCNDNDACTINDVVGTNCLCAGTFADADADGTCDANDLCPVGPEPGAPCNDNDACTINDVVGTNCLCEGTFADADADGTCDANDLCPGGPEPGTPCNDNDACTINDVIGTNCTCSGTFADEDSDGTCDTEDACPNDPNKIVPGFCGCGVADVPITWYADADGDTYGDPLNAVAGFVCLEPSGFVSNNLDCNDSDPNIHPLAYDACPDGIDNNCNGQVDEQAALIGQTCSSTIGVCQPGIWDCINNVLTCVGGVLPTAEICGDGIDNDCDGLVDEDSPETIPMTWYFDADNDGYGDPDPLLIVLSCDPQPGYVLNGNDCNDGNAAINPAAGELCNGIDDNCNGIVDDGTLLTWFYDADNDGYGDPAESQLSCDQPDGYVLLGGDCDDGNPETHPGAPEVCNGIDDDCDGLVDADDPNAILTVWYLDNDGDGYGITGITASACDQPPGFAVNPGDCNDNDANVNPIAPDFCVNGVDNNCNGSIDEGSTLLGQPCTGSGGQCIPATWGCVGDVLTCITGTGPAVEICGDGIDNDCDGEIDELDITSALQTWYLDTDGDGYGDPLQTTESCFSVPGYVLTGNDCDDSNPLINPGAIDICDGLDNNCDGLIDVGTGQTWYLDADGDGIAGGAISIVACAPPPGYTSVLGDCNDNDPTIHPGAFDACPDGIDNNCNGQVDEEAFMIGQACGSSVGMCVQGAWACVNNVLTCVGGVVATAEICGDGIDNDCDGTVDEDSPETIPMTWYIDTDGDGFGDPNPLLIVLSCDQQPGYSLYGNDCNDANAAIHPGAMEICDGLDNNCDGVVDEGFEQQYADGDGDGLGDPLQPLPCDTPGVANNLDCDDTDPAPCVLIEGLVEQRVVGSAGGAAHIGSVHVEWTLGEALVSMIENNGFRLTQGFHQNSTYRLRLNLRALLQGPFVDPTILMTDGLRAGGWIPMTEPYTAAGYVHVEGGNETTSPGVLAVVGPDAIVDWIVVELRDPTAPDLVVATRTGLLQRDGDIVDVDGFSPLAFKAGTANYRVAVFHRNHLPVITAAPVLLSPVARDVDFTDGSIPLHGIQPTRTVGALQLLWAGDVNADGTIRYTGEENDRDPILFSIGGIIPTNTRNGYLPADVNMDGTVKYTGDGNDRDVILFNIGGIVPTNVRNAQMP